MDPPLGEKLSDSAPCRPGAKRIPRSRRLASSGPGARRAARSGGSRAGTPDAAWPTVPPQGRPCPDWLRRGRAESRRAAARRVPPQARPEADARAVRLEAARARSRSSSSSATTRRGCTTTSAWRSTARSRAGRCRRACRWSPASSTSRCTSRTTRSTTRPSRARSRRATTARARSRSGTAARTSCSSASKNGGLTVRLHGKRLDGVWTLVPAKLGGEEKNWLILRKRDEPQTAAEPAKRSRRYAPMLATLEKTVPKGDDWLYEVKWDGYRALAYVTERGRRALQPQRERPDGALRRRREGDRQGAPHPERRARRRGVRARRAGPRDLLRDAAGQGGHEVRLRRVRRARDRRRAGDRPRADRAAANGSTELLDKRVKAVQFSESFDDGEALFEVAKQQDFEGIMAKRPHSTYQPGRRTRDWVKVKATNSQEFVIGGYTRGEGRRAGTFGSLLLGVFDEGASEAPLRRQRRHGLQRRRRSSACSRCCVRSRRTSRRSIRCRSRRACARATSCGSSRSSSPRSSSSSGRTTTACARRPTRGCARTRGRARCTRRSRCRPSSARATACSSSRTSTRSSSRSSGSRRATCSRTTAPSRPCSCRTSRTGRSR